MTNRARWDALDPVAPAGVETWGGSLSDDVDALNSGTSEAVFLPSGEAQSYLGGASQPQGNRHTHWTLASSPPQGIVFSVAKPPDWSAFNVHVLWSRTATAGSGNWVLNTHAFTLVDGASAFVGITFSQDATLVGNQNIVVKTLMSEAVNFGRCSVRVNRKTGDAADDYTEGIYVYGLVLEPVNP